MDDFHTVCLCPQNKTEAIITKALSSLGVQVERGKEVKNLVSGEEHVDVEFADGERSRFAWLVGADGAHSTVRKMSRCRISR